MCTKVATLFNYLHLPRILFLIRNGSDVLSQNGFFCPQDIQQYSERRMNLGEEHPKNLEVLLLLINPVWPFRPFLLRTELPTSRFPRWQCLLSPYPSKP